MYTAEQIQKIVGACKSAPTIGKALKKAEIPYDIEDGYNYPNYYIPYRDTKRGYIRVYLNKHYGRKEVVVQAWKKENSVKLEWSGIPVFFS